MNATAGRILKTYIALTLLSTFAASFIWGVNTLFLLDAGLSITEAFAANAFFTAGMVLFEIPTGVLADTNGRWVSYLFGSATLLITTLLYLLLWQLSGPFWAWALISMCLGLGFTFFSGATTPPAMVPVSMAMPSAILPLASADSSVPLYLAASRPSTSHASVAKDQVS